MSTQGLPTGTVTFLFTDIEGSTKLLNRLGDGFPAVLEAHQRLLREAFAAGDGVEVATEGDSFFVVFPRAPRAVAAAIQGQRALAAHAWPDGVNVKVRMGLHTGEGVLGADNYVGVDVHRAARIAAAGHGGQILVSESTRALVGQTLPEGVTLRQLGEHRLKDLAHPEHLYQVVAEGLEADFPPPRTLDARPTNLPRQLTTFVGRRRELDEIKAALDETRLLTMTGPGGTGKTRLSIQAGSELLDRFEDGVFFVPLAPIRDPELVLPTIAATLGVREDPRRPWMEVLVEDLGSKHLLLLLDNFEQVVPAAPEVGELLTSTERVHVLVTSREPLNLAGEHEYPVPPLGVPDPAHLPALDAMSAYEAVALFIERATAVRPGFAVTNENAPAIAEIAARLDGLPLAIELAAARSRILTPQAMLKRLENRLALLAGGPRDRPERQQTLRGAISWSYDMLEPAEQTVFARLSVFRRGFTVDAAEAVCMSDAELDIDAFQSVESLVTKSLLRQTDAEQGEPRFFMLDTIREYASERLAESGDQREIVERHQRYYLDLAERARPHLTGAEQATWLEVLELEHDNLRGALDRIGAGPAVETALRLVAALWRFWQFRGHLREARMRIEAALALPGVEAFPAALAAAYEAAGGVLYWMADHPAAADHYARSLELYRKTGDRRGEAEALYNLSFPYLIAQDEFADMDRGRGLLEESRAIFEELDDQAGRAKVSWGLGNVHYKLQEWDEGEKVLLESLEANRALEDRFGAGWSLHTLGLTLLRKGDIDGAIRRFGESLELFAGVNDLSGITLLVADFAAVRYEVGDERTAAVLVGAAEAIAERSGTELAAFVFDDPQWFEAIGKIKSDPALKEPYERGQGLSADEAVALALAEEAGGQSTS